jgi:AcrR family transcriptional regulator
MPVPKSLPRPRPEETRRPTATVVSLNVRKQALVRDTIWEAAIDLFAEKGFDQTTVEDIAAAAGTSRRSFFRYFESKSDLMAQPVVSYGTTLTDAIRSCPPTDSPAEVLRQTVISVAKHSAANPRAKKVMEIAAQYPEARQAQVARFAQVQDQVAEAFARRYQQRGKDQTTARILAALTLSLISVAFQSWFEGDQADITVTVEQVLATLCDVACTPANSAHKRIRKG